MPSPSSESDLRFDRDERRALLDVARDAIRRGLERDRRPVALGPLPVRLRRPGATFVTLRRHDELLGCIGTMEPVRSLAEDVHHNAASAAFADPRLPAVTREDFEVLSVKISVLGPLAPLEASGIDELTQVVRAGQDGLLVGTRRHRGTFLPSVWEQVPDPERFLTLLWQKAGLARGSWPSDLVVQRYETIEFGD